jgi:hypothetical protein
MNQIHRILLLLPLAVSLASCQEDPIPKYKTAITVHAQDEHGRPINGANVEIVHNLFESTPGSVVNGKTAVTGDFTSAERSIWSINMACSREGFYPAKLTDYSISDDRIIKKQVTINITLKKITNPIALYAKQNDVPIPEKEKWIGFDLQECDWVKPYGKGTENDVAFFLENMMLDVPMSNGQSGADRIAEIKEFHDKNPQNKASYLEHRDEFFNLPKGTSTYEQAFAFRVHPWRGTLKMRIPSEKGGLIAEKVNYLLYSKSPSSDYVHLPVTEMRMPYHAPTTGYQAEYSWEKIPGQTLAAAPAEFGFFIKTRIKLDEKGNVISAHYAKFITNLEIDIRGRIKFTSYFNPTANDTNLEFDLKKNLFTDLKDLEKPYLP